MPMTDTEKAFHNIACTLLEGLSWATDRLRDQDYRGHANHPLNEPTANVRSSLYDILHTPVLEERDKTTPRIKELVSIVRKIDAELEPLPEDHKIIQKWIWEIRSATLFKGLSIPMDQEVPPHQPWD